MGWKVAIIIIILGLLLPFVAGYLILGIPFVFYFCLGGILIGAIYLAGKKHKWGLITVGLVLPWIFALFILGGYNIPGISDFLKFVSRMINIDYPWGGAITVSAVSITIGFMFSKKEKPQALGSVGLGLFLSWFLFVTTTGQMLPSGWGLFYFLMFIGMMIGFALYQKTRIIVTIYFFILGTLLLLSFLIKFAFPTLPVVSDIVTTILAIGIRSGASLLCLIAVFFAGGELKKDNKKGLLVKAAFLFNGVVWLLQVFGRKWRLTGIMYQVYHFVNLDLVGIILLIVGILSWVILELKGST